MLQASINFWAVLAAVVLKQGIGFIWFSPMLFGRAYREAIGLSEEELKQRMLGAIGGDMMCAFLVAGILAYVVGMAAMGPFYGFLTGLMCWLGFAATASLSPSLFEARPIKAWALQNGYLALAYAAMGAVIGGWR